MRTGCMLKARFLMAIFGFGLSSNALATDIGTSTPDLVVQTGHSVPIKGARFSPTIDWSALGFPERKGKGQILATASNDGTVKIWDTATSREVRVLRLDNGSSIGAVAISPDGTKVAAGGAAMVKIWDVATGREVFEAHDGPPYVRSIAFNADGTKLAVGDYQEARVWNVRDSRAILVVPDPAMRIAFGVDDTLVVAGAAPTLNKSIDDTPNQVAVWNTRTLSRDRSFAGTGFYVYSVAMANDGTISTWGGGLCLGKSSCPTTIRRSSTGRSFEDIEGPPLHPSGGSFCLDASLIAMGSHDGQVLLWDVEGRRTIFAAKTESFIEDVSCSPDAAKLVSGETSGRAVLWDRNQITPVQIFEGYANQIDGFAADPSSSRLMFLGRGSKKNSPLRESVLNWNTTSPKAPTYLGGFSAPLTMSENGRWLAIGKNKQTIVLIRGKEELVIDTGAPASGAKVAFDPTEQLFAVAREGTISIWDLSSGSQRGQISKRTNLLTETIAFSRDGQTLASAGGDGSVELWDVSSLRQRCVLGDARGPEHTVWSIAFSHDRRTLASAGNDRVIQLWDIEACTSIGKLVGHAGAVREITFTSNGKRIASAGWDGTVRLWDVESRVQERILSGHGWLVNNVAFINSDEILVSGGWDGTTRLWEVASGKELATIVTFRDRVNWLIATPEGYFDSTAEAADKIFWRVESTNELVPLSRYYTDFYRPGLLTELLAGKRPIPEVDVAASLGIPSLRTMLSSGPELAHVERRGDQTLICLSVPPGAALAVGIDEETRFHSRQELKVVPDDSTCKYQIDLSSIPKDQLEKLMRLANTPLPPFSTPWDGIGSDTSSATLHVLIAAVSEYPAASGFDPITFPVESARRLLEYFEGGVADGKPFKSIKLHPLLLNQEATTDGIRNALGRLVAEAGQDDVIVIYLAGHGQTDFRDEMFYFATADSYVERLSSTGYSTAMLADALREMNSRRVVLLIDSCQAGGTIEALQRVAQSRAEHAIARQALGYGDQEAVGLYVVAATLPLSYALGSTESAFASALLTALKRGKSTQNIRSIIQAIRTELPLISHQLFGGFRQTPLVAAVGLDFPIAAEPK